MVDTSKSTRYEVWLGISFMLASYLLKSCFISSYTWIFVFPLCSGQAKVSCGGACWRSLSAYIDHQHCTKNGNKQQHKQWFMFIIHLFPLVLGVLCSCRKNMKKYQISSIRRQVDVAGGSGPTWWGRLAQLGGTQRPLVPCHVTNPPQVQETKSQAFSTIDLKSIQHERLEWSITRIADVSWQHKPMWQTSRITHTHSWHVGQASRRREVPPVIGG